MPIREYKGNAVGTQLTSGINAAALSFQIDDPTGWPTGGVNGKFYAVLGRGQAAEEKVLCLSRSGSTITVDTGDRGEDDTVAADWPAGTTVEHVDTATDAREANQHLFNPALDHHTQYMRADGTRHDLTARHPLGSVIPAAGTPTTLTPDNAAAGGVSTNAARIDHVHGIAAATAVTSGLANAEGVSTSFARADHTHDQAALSIDTAELVDNAVTLAKMADNSVGTAELVNAAITMAKFNREAMLTYNPTWTSLTSTQPSLGNGTLNGWYLNYGRLYVAMIELIWGTTTTGGADLWQFSLPDGRSSFFGPGWPLLGLVNANNSGSRFIGLPIVGTVADRIRILDRVTLNDYSAVGPFGWGNADFLQAGFAFISSN